MASNTSPRSSAVYRTPGSAAPRLPVSNESAAHSEIVAKQPSGNFDKPTDTKKPHGRAAKPAAARTTSYLAELVVAVLLAAVIAYTWSQRHEGHITPKTGLGYWLGIAGAVTMLSLLLYPLRKYWKPLHRVGSVRTWFTAHLILGLTGPAAVLVHSNYHLESTNGAVAMTIMGLVVASGVVGRYVYAQIYEEASGKRTEINELLREADVLRAAFGDDMEHAPQIEAELASYEAAAKAYRQSASGGLGAALFLGRRAAKSRALVRREAESIMQTRALRERWTVDELQQRIAQVHAHFDAYFTAVKRAAMLNFFARLFALWHVLHMPLFLLLILAAVGHVLAVHLY